MVGKQGDETNFIFPVCSIFSFASGVVHALCSQEKEFKIPVHQRKHTYKHPAISALASRVLYSSRAAHGVKYDEYFKDRITMQALAFFLTMVRIALVFRSRVIN